MIFGQTGKPAPSYQGLLPYHRVDPCGNVILLSDSASGTPEWLGLMWRLDPVEVETASENLLYFLAGRMEHVLEAVPEGAVCQFLLRTRCDIRPDLTAWEDSFSTENEFYRSLLRSRTEYLSQVNVPVDRMTFHGRTIDVYLTLARKGNWGNAPLSPSAALEGTAFPEGNKARAVRDHVAHLYAQDRRSLLEAGATMESLLVQARLTPTRLNEDEVASVLYGYLNPRKATSRGAWPSHEDAPLRTRLTDSTLEADLDEGTLVLDDTHLKIVSVIEAPAGTVPSALSRPSKDTRQPSLIDQAPDMDLILSFQSPNQDDERNRLGARRRLATNQAKNIHQGPTVDVQRQELEHLEHDLSRGARILKVRLTAIARAESEEAAAKYGRSIATALGNLKLRAIVEDVHARDIFLQTLPLAYRPDCERGIGRCWTVMAPNAADLLPTYGAFRGTPRSTLMMLNRAGQTMPVAFVNGSTAGHGIITGTSGSGKSFLTNQLVQSAYLEGSRVFILDVGRSYKRNAIFFGGTYVDYDEKPLRVNPCERAPSDGSCPQHVQDFLRAWLVQMATQGAGDLPVTDQSLLTEAVRNAYKKRAGQDVYLSHIREALDELGGEYPRARELALCLLDFTVGGAYGSLFDGPSEVDFTNPLVVIDLGKLSKKATVASVILMALMQEVVKACEEWPHQLKYLAVDEMWKHLGSPATATFFEDFARTGRKVNLALILISQGLSDFDGPIGEAISEQAATKLFLMHKIEAITKSAARLKFSEDEVALYQSLKKVEGQFSEVFLKTDYGAGVGRLLVDPHSYWLATTDPPDLELLARLEAQYKEPGRSEREVLGLAVQEAARECPRGVKASLRKAEAAA